MSKELDNSANKLKKLGQNMQSVGRNMTFGITAPIVGLGTAMFKTFADYEDIMTEIQARTQASTEDMEAMSKMAIQMGRDTVFSATEAGQAMLELTASGSSAEEAISMLPHVLNLAAAGAVELGESADAVTDIMKMFGTTMDEVHDITDSLATAAGSSSATVNDLIQGFNNVGPVAASMGLSVNETAAALAVFAENGIKGAEAGTQLRSMLLNMTRDTAKTRGAWESLGTSMYDASGAVRPLQDVIEDINAAMDGMSDEQRNQIARDLAGNYGIIGFNALLAADGIDAMQESMWSAASAQDVAQARMNTLSGSFKSLMGSLETLAITFGSLGEGPLTDLIKWATDAINAFNMWAEANPKLAQTLMLVVAAIAALGPIIWILGSIVSAVSALMPLFGALGVVIGAVSLPVLLLVGAVGLLLAAIHKWNTSGATQTWANNFKMAGEIIERSGQKIGNTLSTGASAWGQNLKNIGTLFEKLRERAVGAMVQLAPKIIMAFKTIIPALKQLGINIIQGLITGVASKTAEFVKTIIDMARKAKEAVQNAFKIRSPSRVMMDMGQQVVAGFNQGIESMGGIGVSVPQLGGASSASPSLGVTGGGGIYINNMNVPAGTTQEQIDHILKEIGKRVKRQGGRGI